MQETVDRIDQAATLLHLDIPDVCDENGRARS